MDETETNSTTNKTNNTTNNTIKNIILIFTLGALTYAWWKVGQYIKSKIRW